MNTHLSQTESVYWKQEVQYWPTCLEFKYHKSQYPDQGFMNHVLRLHAIPIQVHFYLPQITKKKSSVATAAVI